MKKTIKFIVALLFTLCCFCAAAACGQKGDGQNDNQCVFYGFESYEELYSLTPTRFEGKADLNKDKKYITEGEGSLYWFIKNPYFGRIMTMTKGTDAVPKYSIYDTNFYRQFVDFHEVDRCTVDVFNANNYDTTFMFYLLSGNDLVAYELAKLQANCWTTVTMEINQLILAKYRSVNSVHMGVYNEDSIHTECTLYIDNLKIIKGVHTAEPPQTQEIGIVNRLDSLSVLDYVKQVGFTNLPMVKASYNTDIVYARQAQGSLRLSFIPMIDGDHMVTNSYYGENGHIGISFLEEFIAPADWQMVEFLEGGYVGVDVYNDGDTGKYVYLRLKDKNGVLTYGREWIPAKNWGVVKISDFSGVSLSSLDSVDIVVEGYNITEPFSLYVNNIVIGEAK